MKNLFLVLALLALFLLQIEKTVGSWTKYKTIKAGVRPVAVFLDNENNYNIFCAGWDANYNEIFEPDSGDVRPSWWKIKQEVDSIEKILDFEWALLDVPFRPFVYDSIIYIHHNHNIESYNINSGQLLDPDISHLDAIAISVLDNKMFLSLRVDENKDWVIDSNFVVVFDIIKKEILDTIPAYSYVQQTLPFRYNGVNYLAILNEGTFGKNDSKIQIIKMYNNSFEEIKVINIGSAGNHLYYKNNILTVVMNSSRQVHLIEPDNFEITHSVLLDVPAWDGPREAIQLSSDSSEFKSLWFAVSAYDGYIYFFDYDKQSNEFTFSEKLKSDGKPEGMCYDSHNQFLLIANPYISDTYIPNDSITIFSFTTDAQMSDDNDLKIQIFPNPLTNSSVLTIKNTSVINQHNIELVNISGNVVKKFTCFPDKYYQIKITINSDDLGIIAGLYLLKISDGFNIFTIPLLIVN